MPMPVVKHVHQLHVYFNVHLASNTSINWRFISMPTCCQACCACMCINYRFIGMPTWCQTCINDKFISMPIWCQIIFMPTCCHLRTSTTGLFQCLPGVKCAKVTSLFKCPTCCQTCASITALFQCSLVSNIFEPTIGLYQSMPT